MCGCYESTASLGHRAMPIVHVAAVAFFVAASVGAYWQRFQQ